MQTLHTTFTSFPTSPSLSSSNSISLLPKLSALSLTHHRRPPPSTFIRMGGGPRTYPGGVSKWQWKRMQAKKAKQLLKARLSRERQIYEMRKRAELKAAVADLERPWEVVLHKADHKSTLFSVSADEQLKVLADRFQKPGGFDMWSENDGPQIFHTHENLPSARFFPKGVVHSVKPYHSGSEKGGDDRKRVDKVNVGNGNGRNLMNMRRGEDNIEGRAGNSKGRRGGMKGNGRRKTSSGGARRSQSDEEEDVYDMSLQGDGSYGFSGTKDD